MTNSIVLIKPLFQNVINKECKFRVWLLLLYSVRVAEWLPVWERPVQSVYHAVCFVNVLSICVCASDPFTFECGMWNWFYIFPLIACLLIIDGQKCCPSHSNFHFYYFFYQTWSVLLVTRTDIKKSRTNSQFGHIVQLVFELRLALEFKKASIWPCPRYKPFTLNTSLRNW